MKLLLDGTAVLDGDTHISKWVMDSGTLHIAKPMLLPFKQYIPMGGTVIDIGASIGDHTVTYAEWVGEDGYVFAFEPNAEAYECLVHNTEHLNQVLTVSYAVSDSDSSYTMVELANSGASYLTDQEGDILSAPLDSYGILAVNFIKIDVEGYEVRVLKGATETIRTCRPVMLIEVNSSALERAGSSSEELLTLIRSMDYEVNITDSRIPWSDPQYDVLCVPIEKTH